jgi:hypothetical protein
MKRIAIIQSAYIPWRGFFDLIARCDEYVIFDTVQFAKRHWHNRNKLVTPNGPVWLTIPVATKSKFEQAIDEVSFSEPWADKHWRSFVANYARAPFFAELGPQFEQLYRLAGEKSLLTETNEIFLRGISRILGISTAITRDRGYEPQGARSERLLDICRKAGATHYLSGPSARSYLDESLFADAGIKVEWMEYPAYPPYPQVWGEFEPAVSVLDMLFNAGPDCRQLWRTQ